MRRCYHVTVRGPHGTAWCRHVDRARGEKLAREKYRKETGLRRVPSGARVEVMPYQIEDGTVVQIRTGFDEQQDLFRRSSPC